MISLPRHGLVASTRRSDECASGALCLRAALSAAAKWPIFSAAMWEAELSPKTGNGSSPQNVRDGAIACV